MADFLKSALGYLGSSGISQDNSFVGQYVELGDQKLRVKKVIAEGRSTRSVSLTVTVTVCDCQCQTQCDWHSGTQIFD